MGKRLMPTAIVGLLLLAACGSDTGLAWSEDQIGDIAYDAAADAIAEAEVDAVSGGYVEARLADLEQQISDQEMRIQSLESELEEVQGRSSLSW